MESTRLPEKLIPKQHVLECAERGEQIKCLKDEANPLGPKPVAGDFGKRVISLPSTLTVPRSGVLMPEMMLRSDVFPPPLAPTSTTCSADAI